MPVIIERHPAAFLTVAGFGPELEERRAQAAQLGIADRVRFVGAVEQNVLPTLYRRAALLVAPFVEAAGGDQDGLGLVVVEAAGCGCPVVVSELPATRGLRDVSSLISVKRWSTAQELGRAASMAIGRGDRNGGNLAGFDWKVRAGRFAHIIDDVRLDTCHQAG